MKTPDCSAVPSLFARSLCAAAVTLTVFAFSSPVFAQAVVDPDPEIFDGTKTKRDAVKQEPQTAIDDWEGPNLIIYDSDEQGNGQGGTGMIDGAGPGLDIGLPGLDTGLPIPMMGGGMGAGGLPGLPPPAAPPGAGAKPDANTAGAAQSAARPSDVSIGDASQKIATTAQSQPGTAPPAPEDGEQGSKKAEDTTNVPSSSNTNQSGVRGGGVEQGDAMPPDL